MNSMRTLVLSLMAVAMLQVVPPLASDAARTVGLDGLSAALEGVGAAEAAFIRRTKIKQRASGLYRVVVVVGDDSTNNEVSRVEVTIPGLSDSGGSVGGSGDTSDTSDTSTGASASLGASAGATAEDGSGDTGSDDPDTAVLALKVVKSNGNKRFVYKDLTFSDGWKFQGSTVDVIVTMYNELGEQVGDPLDLTVEFEGDENTPTEAAMLREDLEAALGREEALENTLNAVIEEALALEQELIDNPDTTGEAVQGFLDSFFDITYTIEFEPEPAPTVTIPDCAGPDAVAGQPCL